MSDYFNPDWTVKSRTGNERLDTRVSRPDTRASRPDTCVSGTESIFQSTSLESL